MKSKYITVDEYDADLIVFSLTQRLKLVKKDFDLISVAKKRELTEEEIAALPSSLMGYTREQLKGEIDSWYGLVLHYEDLIRIFDHTGW